MTGHQLRAAPRIEADPARRRATVGFSHDGGSSWYVRSAGAEAYEIHRATGLTFEPSPPIRLE